MALIGLRGIEASVCTGGTAVCEPEGIEVLGPEAQGVQKAPEPGVLCCIRERSLQTARTYPRPSHPIKKQFCFCSPPFQ